MTEEWEYIKDINLLSIGDYVKSEGFSCSQKYLFRIDCLEEAIERETNEVHKRELEEDLKIYKDDYNDKFGVREGYIVEIGETFFSTKIRTIDGNIINLACNLGNVRYLENYMGSYWLEVVRKK